MKIKQVYEIVNDAQKEVLGKESLMQEDLSDVEIVGAGYMYPPKRKWWFFIGKPHIHIHPLCINSKGKKSKNNYAKKIFNYLIIGIFHKKNNRNTITNIRKKNLNSKQS